MTTEPMSLFKSKMMRKADKLSRQKALLSEDESVELDLVTTNCSFACVIDGRALLHRIYWIKRSDFQQVLRKIVYCF